MAAHVASKPECTCQHYWYHADYLCQEHQHTPIPSQMLDCREVSSIFDAAYLGLCMIESTSICRCSDSVYRKYITMVFLSLWSNSLYCINTCWFLMLWCLRDPHFFSLVPYLQKLIVSIILCVVDDDNPRLWTTEPFGNAPFKLSYDTINWYQSTQFECWFS